jgi:methionine sulfoxide reductase heme-binding subunit
MPLTTLLSPLILWRDRTGAFSPPRAGALALAIAPAVPLLIRIFAHDLGPRPLTEVSHVTGLWAIRLLAATLAVSPLIALLRRPRLAPARRILGVAVFVWMIAHLFAFVADKMFDPVVVAREIVLRIYLLIGFVALVLLGVLAATSTDAMIARLGAERWRRLHQLVYLIAVLGLVHYFMQAKEDVSEPMALAGVFALLGLLRLPRRFGLQASPMLTLGLSVLASVGTAVTEAAWFGWKFGAPFMTVIESNFDTSLGLRPCWLPLIIGVALAATGFLARYLVPGKQRAPRRRTEAATSSTHPH